VAIHGPFPPDSWAANPNLAPWNPGQARTFADRARAELGNLLTGLDLVYPTGDPAVENACKAIQQQAAGVGLEINLVPIRAFEYYNRVAFSHNFDLAWWRHDFADATFWLGPLLDPAEIPPGGANLLGYEPDAPMSGLLQDLKQLKQFGSIRRATHAIGDRVHELALVIPLWQLHVYVALAPTVSHAELDPIYLFNRVEDWRLEP
jgi:ABC-type transport system substrate-binding protein